MSRIPRFKDDPFIYIVVLGFLISLVLMLSLGGING